MATTKLLIRYGFSPTRPGSEETDARFDGTALVEIPNEVLADDARFTEVVARTWRYFLARGFGHILVGRYDRLEYAQSRAGGCGHAGGPPPIVPQGYTPLYSVARDLCLRDRGGVETLVATDLAVDYREGGAPPRPLLFGEEGPVAALN